MDTDADALTLDLDGWEGPLDLLLALARSQKVDLKQISILALVEQYLTYVEQARSLKLEVAADYLVMAAWLAYLKSALLLPRDPEIEPSPEELALRLQMRLERLNAMRDAGARLLARDRLGRDVFRRVAPEGLRTVRKAQWQAEIYDLIAAYGQINARNRPVFHVVQDRPVMTLDVALERISRLLGERIEWATIEMIRAHVGEEADVRAALDRIGEHFAGRGIELVRRGERWHFQTAGDLAHLLRRDREESRRLSRAAVETLAIIAYHEPVTRAEIEAIRGVQISKGTLDVLMEAGWARPAGRRETPGRPLMFATTPDFLSHFGLASRRDLPGIDDLRAAGLLDPIDLAMAELDGGEGADVEVENASEED